MTADFVIRGGTVVDGTGAPRRVADVAITDGVISEIGERLDGTGARSGRPRRQPRLRRHPHALRRAGVLGPGAVTVVLARRDECGRRQLWLLDRARAARAPRTPRAHAATCRGHVARHPLPGVPWESFETFPQYFDAIEQRGTLLNYACYVGHTAVRLYVMGEAGYEREATDAEIAAMQDVIAGALDAGAAGFATSSSMTHNGDRGRPVPSRIAGLDEFRALWNHSRAGKGVAALLPGEKIKHADVYDLQRGIGRPLTWTALLTVKGFPWHEKIIADNTGACDGVQVWPQVSCRPLVFQMNFREPFTFNMRDAFKELMDRPDAERMAAYRDPAWRHVPTRSCKVAAASRSTSTRSRSPRATRDPSSSGAR